MQDAHLRSLPASGGGRRVTLVANVALMGVSLVFAPLLPGLFWALVPGLSLDVWRDLLANPEWPQALLATLISSFLSTLVALLLAGVMAMQLYPGSGWMRLQRRLTLQLAVPHAAFAVGDHVA